jgi:large subunit ribosomal protein L19
VLEYYGYSYIFAALLKKRLEEMDAIKYVHDQMMPDRKFPEVKPGDNVSVSYKIIEGAKERIQIFKGDVIQIKGHGVSKTFTVRKISGGVGVERIFPFATPNLVEITVHRSSKVRRAKLFYLRNLVGKKARLKEKKHFQQ